MVSNDGDAFHHTCGAVCPRSLHGGFDHGVQRVRCTIHTMPMTGQTVRWLWQGPRCSEGCADCNGSTVSMTTGTLFGTHNKQWLDALDFCSCGSSSIHKKMPHRTGYQSLHGRFGMNVVSGIAKHLEGKVVFPGLSGRGTRLCASPAQASVHP